MLTQHAHQARHLIKFPRSLKQSATRPPVCLASKASRSTRHLMADARPAPCSEAVLPPPWRALEVAPGEVTLDYCLPTGQTFRWRQEGPGRYTGVLGTRLVQMLQTHSNCYYRVLARAPTCDEAGDEEAVRDYFNLPRQSVGGVWQGVRLTELSTQWAQACTRYAHVAPHIPGARMLRQPPLECLMQFICSSNNHITRIHGMVQRLCELYGTRLEPPGGQIPTHWNLTHTHTDTHTTTPTATLTQTHTQTILPTQASVDNNGGGHVKVGTGVLPTMESAMSDPLPHTSVSHQAAMLQQGLLEREGPASAPPAKRRRKGRRSKTDAGGGEGDGIGAAVTDGLVQADAGSVLGPAGRTQPPQEAQEASHDQQQAHYQYYVFPTLEQLSVATEEELRAAGFGYRAKFIVGSVAALLAKEGGGEAWLMGLRERTYQEAAACLEELPGVGPKVAACVCLFSLDKHDAIPVDTHVWQIATRYYGVRSKSLTKAVHGEVQHAFVKRFGPYAGWAHNALFISELAHHKARIPPWKE